MTASLVIDVRLHEGRYYGQGDGFDGVTGWPPSPGRLFQALVSGAARGATLLPEDERALKWLEGLGPPRIAAPVVRRGRAVKLFVPNNDLDAVGGDPARVSEIRVGKQWRPCFFDQEEPIRYVWDLESSSAEAEQVCAIASRLYQLGRGIDMAWASGRVVGQEEADALLNAHSGSLRTPGGASGQTATPHQGTLDSLVDRYRRKRMRLTSEGQGRKSRQLFTQPPKASFHHTAYDTPPRHLHFELRRSDGRFAPRPLTFAMPLLVGLRDAAARRLQDSLPARSALFERLIIGRGAGSQDLAQRIRMIPVPSIGAAHTDPSIRRILVEVPSDCPIRVDDLKWAFAGLQPHDPQTGEIWSGSLVSTEHSRMAERFARRARTFRTMTPAALPVQRRRLGMEDDKTASERSKEEALAVAAVVQALRHAGLRFRPSDIRVQREPFQLRGARTERFAVGARFSKHALWHVEVRFDEPISGPLVIGDGRFCGLGLMQPVEAHNDVVAFELKRRIAREHGPELVGHFRRALMSLARDDAGHVGRLFSGHEPEGRPDSGGHHAHVFLAADGDATGNGSITRLVAAAPWAADRKTKHRNRRAFDGVTRQLTELRAGRLGWFDRLTVIPLEDGDPLVGPAMAWVGETPYVATRNLKQHDDPTEFVKADVAAECVRRGLPMPREILASDLHVGPKGGRPTASLELRFAVSVPGPLLLGRDSHMGGGLFHAVSRSEP